MKTRIDWRDAEAVRAYKAGYMRGQRLYKYLPPAEATALARKVMMNEIERHRKVLAPSLQRKRAQNVRNEGNEAWKALRDSRNSLVTEAGVGESRLAVPRYY